jgi:hypothetical protein
MNTLRKKLISSAIAGIAALSLAACSGSHGTGSAPIPGAVPTASPGQNSGVLQNVTLSITIPAPTSAARRPAYVSQATKSITVVLASPPAGYNQPTAFNVTLGSATCPGAGPWTCTISFGVPPGNDSITVKLWDTNGGTGSILSQQIQTLAVVVGTNNSFNMTFDANSALMVVNGSGSCQNGPVGTAFGSVGTSPITYTVAYTDAAGKTIVAPGVPILEIQDNTATFQSSSGTINGTGGTIAFTINQAAQTFTLTPSNSTTTNASINVKAVPANSNGSSDGLAFANLKSFTFSTGVAPPTHNFLAAVEQLSAASGKVDFYNMSLGGSGGPDTFSAFSPATLAVTASTNQAGVNDVDNPLDLVWDSTGDLLIGNGGGSVGDTGNLACVPIGAIATGANSSTTVTQNVDDPVGIAYDSRDGSVALANDPTSASFQLAEYLLTGNYTAAGASRNLHVAGLGSGLGSIGGSVVNLPSLTAGSYAISLTDGIEVDPAHGGGTSKIAELSPTGVETDITNPTSPTTFAIDKPVGIAWDAANSQLVIANASLFHKNLSFYSLPATQVKVISTGHAMNLVATSPDGHVAVAWVTSFGYEQVQVYDNTASRNPVNGPIPYNGTTTSCGSTYVVAQDTVIVNGLTWLTNTKLLVAVQANDSGVPNANNGIYVYDISASAVPAGFDDVTCAAFAAAPKQSGFQHTANKPLGLAFKP